MSITRGSVTWAFFMNISRTLLRPCFTVMSSWYRCTAETAQHLRPSAWLPLSTDSRSPPLPERRSAPKGCEAAVTTLSSRPLLRTRGRRRALTRVGHLAVPGAVQLPHAPLGLAQVPAEDGLHGRSPSARHRHPAAAAPSHTAARGTPAPTAPDKALAFLLARRAVSPACPA